MIIPQEWENFLRKHQTMLELGVFVVLTLVLVVVLLVKFFWVAPEVPPGAVHVLYCDKCQDKKLYQIVDIVEQKPCCQKCGEKVQQLQKCRRCGFEFPEPPSNRDKDPKKYRNLKDLVESKMCVCPNCKSKDSFPVPPSLAPNLDSNKVIMP